MVDRIHWRRWLLLAVALLLLVLSGCARSRGGDSAASEGSVEVAAEATTPALVVTTDQTRISVPPGSKARWSSARSNQPDNPKGDADVAIRRDADGAVAVRGRVPDAEVPSFVLADMWWVQLVGIVLVLAGGALVVMRHVGATNPIQRAVMAAVPKGSGWVVAATGGTLIVLPYYLEQYGWTLPLVALLVVAWVAYRWYSNRHDASSLPPLRV